MYLGIDCPLCGRRRLLVDSDGVECEKCGMKWDEPQSVVADYQRKAFAEAVEMFYKTLGDGWLRCLVCMDTWKIGSPPNHFEPRGAESEPSCPVAQLEARAKEE